jgi:hypothetical protein
MATFIAIDIENLAHGFPRSIEKRFTNSTTCATSFSVNQRSTASAPNLSSGGS